MKANINGVELTKDQLKLLKLALSDFNWCDIICSEEREIEYRRAYDDLMRLIDAH